MNNITLKKYLETKKLLCDGALGTYFKELYNSDELPELCNTLCPEKIEKIHKNYIASGSKLIRTNTFASNTLSLDTTVENVLINIHRACEIAFSCAEAASEKVFVAGDVGPIPYENISFCDSAMEEYIAIVKEMLACDVDCIIFETFSDITDIIPAIEYIKNNSDTFISVHFTVNQFGYSSLGINIRKLLSAALDNPYIDSVGLNCGIGPGHIKSILNGLNLNTNKPFAVFPNAGYPEMLGQRMSFTAGNSNYFSDVVNEISGLGISVLGGCCGTNPEYIKKLSEKIDFNITNSFNPHKLHTEDISSVTDNCFISKAPNKNKLIAVELAPPFDGNAEKILDAAHLLKDAGVDILTFPDSPSGRTRADSILVAEKVKRETGLLVMPHLCCRDKNAIAIRSQLLGAYLNDIKNFLVMTGDPIPATMRTSIKSVFNFNSVGLMNIIDSLNVEHFPASPIAYGGVINQSRVNIDAEAKRVHQKMEAGARFFLTQPAFSRESIENIRYIKEKTGAAILCGIMPLVSYKNAIFMKNEMSGINVPDEIIERYKAATTKEEGEEIGISIAREIMSIADFCDGYYFSFPFNRVYMLQKLLV